ncbi:MAG TPA: hemerythrin domain-containing protein [Mycobacteriales bacterium]|nr:hemerythrin domain-containing protein [Mycobacteriales bacterium]
MSSRRPAMCEYCGCQSIGAIGELTREHEAVVNLIGDVRTAAAHDDLAGMAETARRIAAILAPHTQVEEVGLFPALTDEFPDHIAALRLQHRRVDAVLREAAERTPTDPAWPHRLHDALEMLREHILAEQDGVFPAALANLGPADWDSVDAVRTRAGSALSRITH